MIFPWVANFISFNIIKTPDLALEESIKSDNHKRVFFYQERISSQFSWYELIIQHRQFLNKLYQYGKIILHIFNKLASLKNCDLASLNCCKSFLTCNIFQYI